MPTAASRRSASLRADSPRRPRCRTSTSAIWSKTVITGLRLVDGSWKIIAICPPRTSRIADSGRASRSGRRIAPAASDTARQRQQAHERQRGHRLAAAGLAQQCEGLARAQPNDTPSTGRSAASRAWWVTFSPRTASSSVALARCWGILRGLSSGRFGISNGERAALAARCHCCMARCHPGTPAGAQW